jgi:RND family efflux transporter MFP subunit
MAMRIWASIQLKKETKANCIPLVSITKAKPFLKKEKIVLPGSVLAWHEAPIFARIDGYIQHWYVDIGAKVHKGDLLAMIEAPELDAQLRQAEADLDVAIAENALAQVTAKRWLNLRKSDSVSAQDTIEKVDNAKASAATVISRRSNRDRLQQLVGFKRVVAPFDGIISDRRTDIGALINLGSTPSQQNPLFRMVQTNPLRLYIKVPQAYSTRIQKNMQVGLQFNENPGKTFAAKLLSTASAIDPQSRTLLTQFLVENKEEILLPGAYTTVRLSIPPFPTAVRLPINALIFQKKGLQIAMLDKDHRVVLKNIRIRKDFGNYVEITEGVTPKDTVIINPSDSIAAGQKVRIASTKAIA